MKISGLFKYLAALTVVLTLSASCSASEYIDYHKGAEKSVFKDYTGAISAQRMYDDIKVLAGSDDARVTGFDGEKSAANYISDRFESIGIKVERRPFPLTVYRCSGTGINIAGYEKRDINTSILVFSAPTGKNGITAQAVFADNGSKDILAGLDVKGKIVLMKRGGDYFCVKTANAAEAGAAAAIYYDPAGDDPISATLVNRSAIPAVCIGRTDGEFIKGLLDSGRKVNITLKVDSEFIDGYSENILATLKAADGVKNARTVVVGAHFDGINTPGANDNASGIAVLLESAGAIAREKLKCNVRFMAFGAEEVCLKGSTRYVDSLNREDRENILAMINLDMVGIGDTLYIHTMRGDSDQRIADLAQACAEDFGYAFKRSLQRASDHEPFESAGIPVAYLEYGPETVHHTDNDTADRIQKEALMRVCNVVAAMVKEMGTNPGRCAR